MLRKFGRGQAGLARTAELLFQRSPLALQCRALCGGIAHVGRCGTAGVACDETAETDAGAVHAASCVPKCSAKALSLAASALDARVSCMASASIVRWTSLKRRSRCSRNLRMGGAAA